MREAHDGVQNVVESHHIQLVHDVRLNSFQVVVDGGGEVDLAAGLHGGCFVFDEGECSQEFALLSEIQTTDVFCESRA